MFSKSDSQGWGSRVYLKRRPKPIVPEQPMIKSLSNKPHTIADEDTATLGDWLNCYGYLVLQPKGYLWLTGLVPNDQRQIVADRVRQKLEAGRAGNQIGLALVSRRM